MRIISFMLLALFPLIANAQLKINEIMSNNVSYMMDDDFNYSMWVELYNPSSTDNLNQASYYFTDDLATPDKWAPVSKQIAPNGYVLLWFEREDRTGHASFKLEPGGATLYMLNSSLQVIDSIAYPAQYRNTSYGRKKDAGSEWVFFEEPSPAASNNGKSWATQRCPNPVPNLKNGFFTASQQVSFALPATGDTIYYTTDCSEPTRSSTRYVDGSSIAVTATTIIRAKTFSTGKLSSDIVSSTYFINQRMPDLPIVSISTTQANLTDPKTGIYCDGDGTNGLTGSGQTVKRNYLADWDRPANVELFDKTGTSCLNQEVDIKILGGWTRANPLKSTAICPKKKFGTNQLDYDVFKTTKPGHKYKDIQLRNSGNDFYYSMMRDGFMQSLVMHRMDIDYLAYQPAVVFMNGTYYGIENLRERSNTDYIWSNYGLDEDDVTLIEATIGLDTDNDIATDTGFLELSGFLTDNDLTAPEIYEEVCNRMDVNEYINYMLSQIYFGNYDWPHNNVKMWKKTDGGKWRWTLFDTDFGFSLYNSYTHNTLTYALDENGAVEDWATVLFRRLITSETFLNTFIDRFAIHISTTFETSRVNTILDSLASAISTEITYHKNKWGSSRDFNTDIQLMKTFSANRPATMLGYISSRFLGGVATQTIKLSANVPGASYKLNTQPIIDSVATIFFFKDRSYTLEANPIAGYRFKQWESSQSESQSLVPYGSIWRYFDGSAIPADNWYDLAFNDSAWSSGPAQLGYGDAGGVTTLSYGTNSTNKYTTAYFRNTITLDSLSSKTDFQLTAYYDDGIVVYVNGHEIGRGNMPSGTVSFSTFSTTYNEGDRTTFNVPEEYLVEGDNLIAAEVHQCDLKSSDLIFDVQLTCTSITVSTSVITDSVYSGVLNENQVLKAIYESSDEPVSETFICINEVVSSNQTIMDEYAEMDDYLEIYNAGAEDVNVGGWYLTDTPDNKTLSQISSADASKTTVPARGRIVLWADEDEEQGILHAGFKLGKEGETIVLSRLLDNLTFQLIDSVTYPSMSSNMSYSRTPDGGNVWVVQAPTWNSENTPSILHAVSGNVLTIYPTLVTESFHILNASGYTVSVIDLTGKILFRSSCESDELVIPSGDLRPGIYLVRAGNQTFKIIKK